jgi:hypothetical protein
VWAVLFVIPDAREPSAFLLQHGSTSKWILACARMTAFLVIPDARQRK